MIKPAQRHFDLINKYERRAKTWATELRAPRGLRRIVLGAWSRKPEQFAPLAVVSANITVICALTLSCLMVSAAPASAQDTTAAQAHKAKVVTLQELRAKQNYMADKLLPGRGITDKRVLEAMRTVPRHLFVPVGQQKQSYEFGNIQIGSGQVIGDPFIVALMTQALEVKPTDVVLEVGTGSGYQAAVLSKLAKKIYSIEIVPELERSGKARLQKLGYANVQVKLGDGYLGWPEYAPFDAIIVTAHPDSIPPRLVQQLKPGARMVLPVGGKVQRMQLVTKLKSGEVKVENLDMSGLVITGRF
jgi:protein-L-isoaspartate(D-aspartate) O-methyltransferase